MEPSYDQSFDIKLTEEHLGVTFLTVQLKQSRLFAVKGDFIAIVNFLPQYIYVYLQTWRLEVWSLVAACSLVTVASSSGSGLSQGHILKDFKFIHILGHFRCPKEQVEAVHILNTPAGTEKAKEMY